MKTAIYYFTGTGNNLAAARIIQKELPDADLLRMELLKSKKEIPTKYDTVVFLSPVYYSHLPPFVTECMTGLKFSNGCSIYTVACSGINRGLALQDMRLLLSTVGIIPRGEFMIAQPGNFIISYDRLPHWVETILWIIGKKKAVKIGRFINSGKRGKRAKPGFFYQAKYEKALQAQIESFSTIGKQFSASSACIGCGHCAKNCPTGNIFISNGKPTFGANCTMCMRCIQWCPTQAVDCTGRAANRTRYHHRDVASII